MVAAGRWEAALSLEGSKVLGRYSKLLGRF
jgi:hypothetical protein